MDSRAIVKRTDLRAGEGVIRGLYGRSPTIQIITLTAESSDETQSAVPDPDDEQQTFAADLTID